MESQLRSGWLSIGQSIHYIITAMKNHKSLLHTNPYLGNKKLRVRLLVEHAAASARIEGIKNAKGRAERIARKSHGPSSRRG